MTNYVEDIVNAALEKNQLNMRQALDLDLSSRVNDVLDNMRSDAAASLFGASSVEAQPEAVSSEGTE